MGEDMFRAVAERVRISEYLFSRLNEPRLLQKKVPFGKATLMKSVLAAETAAQLWCFVCTSTKWRRKRGPGNITGGTALQGCGPWLKL